MSATLDILEHPGMMAAAAEAAADQEPARAAVRAQWNPESFAKEQARGLVQQVFFPGWPRPARQVVFSGIDETTDAAPICARVVKELADQVPGKVCIVEANLRSPVLHELFGNSAASESDGVTCSGQAGKGAKQISGNLWFVAGQSFAGENELRFSPAGLRYRLGELRREFEYAVIHAPTAGLYNEATLLGQLCDGMILVLQAHHTRRIAARKAKDILQAANVRLLGTVLNQRTFPIPEGIYRRL